MNVQVPGTVDKVLPVEWFHPVLILQLMQQRHLLKCPGLLAPIIGDVMAGLPNNQDNATWALGSSFGLQFLLTCLQCQNPMTLTTLVEIKWPLKVWVISLLFCFVCSVNMTGFWGAFHSKSGISTFWNVAMWEIYLGYTNDLEERIKHHSPGQVNPLAWICQLRLYLLMS